MARKKKLCEVGEKMFSEVSLLFCVKLSVCNDKTTYIYIYI